MEGTGVILESLTGACNPRMPQLQDIGGVPMIKQSTVLTPDTFYDYLLIMDLEGTCGEGGALISSTKQLNLLHFYEGNVCLYFTHFAAQTIRLQTLDKYRTKSS